MRESILQLVQHKLASESGTHLSCVVVLRAGGCLWVEPAGLKPRAQSHSLEAVDGVSW